MDVLVMLLLLALSVGLGCAIGWGAARLLLRALSAAPTMAMARSEQAGSAGLARPPVFNTAAPREHASRRA